jgi:hypothetical protein
VIFRARIYAGDALLNAAGALASVGRRLLGKPVTHTKCAAPAGAREVHLDRIVPRWTPALRLDAEASEVVKVLSVDGHRVRIDRPLAQSYPKGAVVAVLV